MPRLSTNLRRRLGHGYHGRGHQSQHLQGLLVVIVGKELARKCGHQCEGRLDAGLHLNKDAHGGQRLLHIELGGERGAILQSHLNACLGVIPRRRLHSRGRGGRCGGANRGHGVRRLSGALLQLPVERLKGINSGFRFVSLGNPYLALRAALSASICARTRSRAAFSSSFSRLR